jgi:hypothetical protein
MGYGIVIIIFFISTNCNLPLNMLILASVQLFAVGDFKFHSSGM